MTQSVNASSHLTLNFALHHANGATIDSTFDKGAVELTIGDGNLLAGFEACLDRASHWSVTTKPLRWLQQDGLWPAQPS